MHGCKLRVMETSDRHFGRRLWAPLPGALDGALGRQHRRAAGPAQLYAYEATHPTLRVLELAGLDAGQLAQSVDGRARMQPMPVSVLSNKNIDIEEGVQPRQGRLAAGQVHHRGWH